MANGDVMMKGPGLFCYLGLVHFLDVAHSFTCLSLLTASSGSFYYSFGYKNIKILDWIKIIITMMMMMMMNMLLVAALRHIDGGNV